MIYLKWTCDELATLKQDVLYTEVDDDGWVQRELAVAIDGRITHQIKPTVADPGWFGLSRLATPMLTSNVSRTEFEYFWRGKQKTRPVQDQPRE